MKRRPISTIKSISFVVCVMLGDIFLWLKTRLLNSQTIHPTTPTRLHISNVFFCHCHFIVQHNISYHISSLANAFYTSQYLSFLTAMVLQLDCFENLIAGANGVFSFYFPYGHEVTKIWEGEWMPSAFLKTMFFQSGCLIAGYFPFRFIFLSY